VLPKTDSSLQGYTVIDGDSTSYQIIRVWYVEK
jgi:hypothetical protein